MRPARIMQTVRRARPCAPGSFPANLELLLLRRPFHRPAVTPPRPTCLRHTPLTPLAPRNNAPSLRPVHRRGPLPRRPYTASPSAPPGAKPAEPALSLTQRLRKLSREYGWSAFGVYMALTALDLPLCFLAVRWLGTERIGRWEEAVVTWVRRAIPLQIPETWRKWWREDVLRRPPAPGEAAREGAKLEEVGGLATGFDHGVKEAEAVNEGDNASIWTQLALAYAIHKSFIFIRVPITAAITPKVVKTLRGWGWNIGKRRPKAEREAAKAARRVAKAAKQ